MERPTSIFQVALEAPFFPRPYSPSAICDLDDVLKVKVSTKNRSRCGAIIVSTLKSLHVILFVICAKSAQNMKFAHPLDVIHFLFLVRAEISAMTLKAEYTLKFYL